MLAIICRIPMEILPKLVDDYQSWYCLRATCTYLYGLDNIYCASKNIQFWRNGARVDRCEFVCIGRAPLSTWGDENLLYTYCNHSMRLEKINGDLDITLQIGCMRTTVTISVSRIHAPLVNNICALALYEGKFKGKRFAILLLLDFIHRYLPEFFGSKKMLRDSIHM
jgi:hypothetical protein